jgi:hypothetical protein
MSACQCDVRTDKLLHERILSLASVAAHLPSVSLLPNQMFCALLQTHTVVLCSWRSITDHHRQMPRTLKVCTL